MTSIMYRHEVPFGHRLMHHPGKCRFPHGHNYVFEVTACNALEIMSDMVMDFSTLKAAVRDVLTQFDHAFVLHKDDPFAEVLRKVSVGMTIEETVNLKRGILLPTKVVLIDRQPTAEILANLVALQVRERVDPSSVISVVCYEQRDCSAATGYVMAGSEIVKIVDSWET